MSGGQRQREAQARGLLSEPTIRLRDEPNSSLDEAGERDLIQAMKQLKATGSTIVVISHRTNLLEVADSLLLLRDGQTAMFGPRDEVLAALQKAAAQNKAPQAAVAPGGSPQPVVLRTQTGGAA